MTAASPSIRDHWNAIETHLARLAPAVLKSLRPGASERSLQTLEKRLGFPLPADLRQSLAIHDGQLPKLKYPAGKGGRLGWAWFFDSEHLLPVEGITRFWTSMNDLAKDDLFDVWRGAWPGLRKDSQIRHASYWNPKWIPITNAEGDGFCVDMDPSPRGNLGQVFYFCRGDHWPRADGVVPWRVLAPSYAAWLNGIAQLLADTCLQPSTDGRRVVSEPKGIVFKRLLGK